MWKKVRHWAGRADYMHTSLLTWCHFRRWLKRLVPLHQEPFEQVVAIWLANQLKTCAPPTLVTYARQLNHQATLQGLPPVLNSPPVHHILQAAFNMVYNLHPMQQWQAAPLHPQDLQTLDTSSAQAWLKALFTLAALIAARLKDLLGPMSLIEVPAQPATATPEAEPEAPAALLKIYNHKVSGMGRRAPPLILPVPPHPVLDFLRKRARPHPTLFFPECTSTQEALRLVRQHIPHPCNPIHCYSARNAGIAFLGRHLPDSTVQQTVGHANIRTTRAYLRNTLTFSQRRAVSMVTRLHRP